MATIEIIETCQAFAYILVPKIKLLATMIFTKSVVAPNNSILVMCK